MSLQPGDVISTGTPPGVGLGMKPPVWLKPGDAMRLGIEGSENSDSAYADGASDDRLGRGGDQAFPP